MTWTWKHSITNIRSNNSSEKEAWARSIERRISVQNGPWRSKSFIHSSRLTISLWRGFDVRRKRQDRLRHPNVVDVTDFGIARTTNGPVAYLVMEYLDGCTLAEIVSEEGALPIAWVIDILEQVCAAVEEAHRAGIIHRDLKPDNIWLEPNGRGGYTVKVLDFGLVKLAQQDDISRGLCRLTQICVNPRLISGEFSEESATLIKSDKSDGDRIGDGHSFLYVARAMSRRESRHALGHLQSRRCCLSSTDRGNAFVGSPQEVIELHKTAEPPPIREKNRKLPRKMAHIVMSALAKDPAERPQSAAGFAAALRAS